jgi:hypothetical protein
LRGSGTETCSSGVLNYRERRGIGSVISLNNLIAQNEKYQTSFVTDSVLTVR